MTRVRAELEKKADELSRTAIEAAEQLFTRRLAKLSQGALALSQNLDDEAKDLIECMHLHLLTGALTPTMTTLLATYLNGLDSPQRWALLGLNSRHRRKSKTGQEDRAISAYAQSIHDGQGEDEALVDAYNAYFASAPSKPNKGPDTYASDLGKPGNRFLNKAEQRKATVLHPVLVKAGFVPQGTPGRPTIKKSKKN